MASRVQRKGPTRRPARRRCTSPSIAEAREGRDYRLLADILAGLLTGARQRDRAQELAREWGAYLVGRRRPEARAPRGRRARTSRCCRRRWPRPGSTPRFRRRSATDRRDHAARLPLPGPAGGTPRAGLRRPSGPARRHARGFQAPDGARERSSPSPNGPRSAARWLAAPEAATTTYRGNNLRTETEVPASARRWCSDRRERTALAMRTTTDAFRRRSMEGTATTSWQDGTPIVAGVQRLARSSSSPARAPTCTSRSGRRR